MIQIKLTICLVVSLLSSSMMCQTNVDDRLLVYEAERIYREGTDMQKAVKLYKTAFDASSINVAQILDAIDCASSIKDSASLEDFIKTGILAGLDPGFYRKNWKRLGNGLNFERIIARCDTSACLEAYNSKLKQDLIEKMKYFAFRDQEFRGQEDGDWKLQRKNDSLNWKELKKICIKHRGLPKYSQLGMDASDDLELIFIHMDKNEIEFFLPYIIRNIRENESNLAETILYQLDRIGRLEGIIYTITSDYKLSELAPRTRMKNAYLCQAYGEWFKERCIQDNKLYFVPIDPNISIKELNKIRSLFALDSIESKWAREPWAKKLSIEEFEEKID